MAEPQASENRHPAEKVEKKKKPVRKILLVAILASVVIFAGIFGLRTATGSKGWLPSKNTNTTGQADIEEEQQAEAALLTAPEIIAAGNGNGIYYCVDSDFELTMTDNDIRTIDHVLLTAVKDYLSKGTEAETITREEFQRASETETLSAQYSCSIPFEDFTDHNRLKTPSGSTVHYLSRLILSAENDGMLYLYDGKEHQYYRIKRRKHSVILTGSFISGLVKNISDNSRQILYANSGFWSGEEDLLPQKITVEENIDTDLIPRPQNFSPEYNITDNEDLQELETLFFPEGMDFIQKIKTSEESLIYMYGSMEKMLYVNNGGGFTYTQETGSQKYLKIPGFLQTSDFYDSLALAVQYIKSHGGWPSEINKDITVRLISADKIKQNKNGLFPRDEEGYRFTFALEIGGFRLSYQEGIQLSVDLYEKTVAVLHRDLPDLSMIRQSDESSMDSSKSLGTEEIQQDSTSSDSFSRNDSGESALSSTEKKSAFFSEGGSAQSLRTVILINSLVLSDALNEEETEQELIPDNIEEPVDTEDILQKISGADLHLFRVDISRSISDSSSESSGSASSDIIADGNTEHTLSSGLSADGGSEAAFTNHSTGNLLLVPAWRIRVGNRVFWFHAQTGSLLQN